MSVQWWRGESPLCRYTQGLAADLQSLLDAIAAIAEIVATVSPSNEVVIAAGEFSAEGAQLRGFGFTSCFYDAGAYLLTCDTQGIPNSRLLVFSTLTEAAFGHCSRLGSDNGQIVLSLPDEFPCGFVMRVVAIP